MLCLTFSAHGKRSHVTLTRRHVAQDSSAVTTWEATVCRSFRSASVYQRAERFTEPSPNRLKLNEKNNATLYCDLQATVVNLSYEL